MGHKHNQLRVMLINPPQKYFGESLGFNSYFPIGLLSCASMARDLCEIKIYDCLVEDFTEEMTDGFTVYGASSESIRKRIEAFSPDIVGISVPFSAQSMNANRVAKICREIDPNVPVFLGGPHPSVRFKYLLENDFCDYCVVGEGEVTFKEIVKQANSVVESLIELEPEVFHAKAKEALSKHVFKLDGVACIEEGVVKYKPRSGLTNLDDIPFPAYDLIDKDLYLNSKYLYKSRSAIGQKSISMITSRGCPYKCVFCSIQQHMGSRYRFHSNEYIIRHIRHVIEHIGVRGFHFEDDNFTFHRVKFNKLLDEMIKADLGIKWDTPNGIRADSLTKETLTKMKQVGASCLQIAIESGNERVLNEVIKKESKLDAYLKVAEWCHQLDITLGAFYVIGFPGETLSDMEDTTKLALHLFSNFNVFPILLFATPLYGTELYLTSLDLGLIEETLSDEEFAQATQFYGKPLIHTKDFTTDDLKRIAQKFENDMDIVANKRNALRRVMSEKSALLSDGGDLKSKIALG